MDLIDMMCNCYDSPLDAAEDEPQYNFSKLPDTPCSSLMHMSHFSVPGKLL